MLLSIHGLVRSHDMELGKDADTGGQVKYVIELARGLSNHPEVSRIDLLTRQIFGKDKSYESNYEKITDKANIIRLPCGPKRYLKKESLWPYLDAYIDQVLQHIKKVGRIPNVIHAHYADAGYVGAQLARLLGVTFIFTGHSLGRVKQKTLIEKGKNLDSIEKKFNFKRRIEAEELALDTASIVIVSTNQEIEEQYNLYDHYIPQRMKVIPPGVDLSKFSPPNKNYFDCSEYYEQLKSFLKNPEKPMVLAIARPDEKKNFSTLLRAYAENSDLMDKANLVLIAGNRGELNALGSGARRVLRNLMLMIDKYNLYGFVAYPKHHLPKDIPDLYRLAAFSKGVFVNPAFNEPFGLTLIEAAASGLPIVATNDGGPRDIISYCNNGTLIDPKNSIKLGEDILSIISNNYKWGSFSSNGIKGVNENFSWESHINKYVKEINNLTHKDLSQAEIAIEPVGLNRFTSIDRMIAINIDEVFIQNIKGISKFYDYISSYSGKIALCFISRYSLKHIVSFIKQYNIPVPDVLVSSAGAEINYGRFFIPDLSWQKHINYKWNPQAIYSAVSELSGLDLEEESENSFFKISFIRTSNKAPKKRQLVRHLRNKGIRANVIYSNNKFLDIMPIRNSISLAIRYLIFKWGISSEHFLLAASSNLHEDIFAGRTFGVVINPYSEELIQHKSNPYLYFTENENIDGLIEGINHYNFFNDINHRNYEYEENIT